MKKVLSIILAVFCISLLHSYADNDNSNQYKVPITVKENSFHTGIDRSLDQYADVYQYINTNTIEVEFHGLGEGVIYIIDQNNQVVESVPVWECQNCATLSAPQNSGTYILVICCSRFYGEGVFSIR